VLAVFTKLGLTSFGGPVAHLGYFRREFVARRGWLDDAAYTDLIALCQFLPGPASSQVGFSVGLARAGWLGGLAAWCGFTLPSVLLLIAFAAIAPDLVGGPIGTGLVHGLKLAAVAVVAQAVWDMSRRLCTDTRRVLIALVAIALSATLHSVYAQLFVIAAGAVAGLALCRSADAPRAGQGVEPGANRSAAALPATAPITRVSHAAGLGALALFCALLFGLPAWLHASPPTSSVVGSALHAFDAFYRSGALVFGGGHVVLPLLQQQSAITNAVSANTFLAGYGAAQAVPGPLFTFAAYLGWTMQAASGRLLGAALATIGIFLPGLLLVVAALPHWQALRRHPSATAMLAGVNAAVVGVLASALYTPVWTSAVVGPFDFAVAATAFIALVRLKWPPLAVVAVCASVGFSHALI
jgi:chromate transporter